MRRRLLFWEIGGFLWTGLLGLLLHFTGQWLGGPVWASVSPVNESVWEHMKLLFVPLLLLTVLQLRRMGRYYPNFLAARTVSILAGLILIPVLYYTYTGAIGFEWVWLDVAIFYLAALGVFLLDGALLRRSCLLGAWQQLCALALLCALAFCFLWCTFRPVSLPLWQDPQTGVYGLAWRQ